MTYQLDRRYMGEQMRGIYMTERDYRNYRRRIRRQREIRRRIFMAVFTVFLIIGLAVSYHAITSHAETEPEIVYYKYFTKIDVEYGDSLWSIAQEYADDHYKSTQEYINEVKKINHLSGDLIREGQRLVVPYYSSEYK